MRWFHGIFREIWGEHTVLAITAKSPEIKDLRILEIKLKIDFLLIHTLQGP